MGTKRGNRIRGPFVLFLASLFILLVFSYFNYEVFLEWGNYVLPNIVQTSCTSSGAPLLSANESTCIQCSKTQEKVVVQEKIVEKIVNVNAPTFKQWWAEGKPWHTEGKFPLCSMDTCFNFTRCENMDELLVYHYDTPTSPVRYFEGLNSTSWYTSDPEKACLFFVFQDLETTPWRPHPNTVKYWNNGLNHILITFADIWYQRNPSEDTIGNASVLSSALLETTYRPGFDIGIPLPGKGHVTHLQTVKPSDRKYLLTFRGTRYLGRRRNGEGVFRSDANFRNMHNGKDVVVVTSCSHLINDMIREEEPELGKGCDEDQELYDQYDFADLMNSTFSLAPAGISGSSYRFIEVLSAGAIPVLVVDNHVKPFENIIQWTRCALQFPTKETHRIVSAVRAMSREEIEVRQKYCLWVYGEFLKDDSTLLRSVMRSLKARFYGVFPQFSNTASIFANK
ncbi:unnamed protein product [Calypogeia fissa]